MVATNLSFVLGETWEIAFDLNDAQGNDLDLTDAVIGFRLMRRNVVALDLGADSITIGSPPTEGAATLVVSPDDQAALIPAVYSYEIRVTLQDGRVTTQAAGALTVERSLFAVEAG